MVKLEYKWRVAGYSIYYAVSDGETMMIEIRKRGKDCAYLVAPMNGRMDEAFEAVFGDCYTRRYWTKKELVSDLEKVAELVA